MRLEKKKGTKARGAALARRDFLRLLAGVPVVIGLPALARADEEDGCAPPQAPPEAGATVAQALAAARAAGRPVLLLAPPGEDAADWQAGFRRRQRFARRLHALLDAGDARVRLAVANLVIVVAPERGLAEAAGPLPAARAAGRSSAWLLSTLPAAPVALVEGALDADDAAAEALQRDLARAVLGGALAARAEAEEERLGPRARAEVVAAIADLASPRQEVRDGALAALASRREQALATLTQAALDHPDEGARERCAQAAYPADLSLAPVGTQWAEFHAGCGVSDPYHEELGPACGMAITPGPAKRFLVVLAGP